MADNSALVPLTFKPGIKRDGTKFDSEYCIEGNWMRFYNGKPKSIGGIESGGSYSFPINENCTCLLITPNPSDANKIFAYFATKNYIKRVKFNLSPFSQEDQGVQITPNITGRPNLLWQAITLVKPADRKKYVVFLGTNSLANINDNSPPILYYGVDEEATTALTSLNIDENLKLMNGGLCWASPYLFLYGSNGIVRWSKNNDPFDFSVNPSDPATGGSIIAGDGDKVIYGAQVRGGSASPSLLFWTLSSVVRVSNVGDNEVSFKADILMRDVSILSSRCVIRQKDVFFWAGTDKFYVYNGIVDELPNETNKNYFFDNLDFSSRQKVIGVPTPRFSECWWICPQKRDNNNNRVFIFNNRGSVWYDTLIATKTAAFYYGSLGKVFSVGRGVNNTYESNAQIWQHESGIGETSSLTGVKVFTPISSSVTTPYFSLASISKAQGNTGGTDRYVAINRVEPDFIIKDARSSPDPTGYMQINTLKYPQSKVRVGDIDYFFQSTEKIDCRDQGRYMNLTFGAENLEMGNVMLLLSPGDGQ